MHLIERIVEQPHSCAYLAHERASLELRVMVDVSAPELEAMLERGWRRFGPVYFRPVCGSCSECVSLRVVVDAFAPTKRQRRAARAQRRLRRLVGAPRVDAERVALYAKWHAERERLRGWEPNPQSLDRYALEFAFPHPAGREAAFYDDADGGRLVGVGLFDETPHALSAVFFFRDPAYAHLSLGTSNVLALIDDARAAGRAHVYLGYRVAGCASLTYKAAFRPHELLRDRPGAGHEAVWTKGATHD
ncbi:MAG: GNAT family N-acetyltransferase [Myxococcota bacterium]|nr:GNAT family N-acetyltransferase [Myxococcota bacterium]